MVGVPRSNGCRTCLNRRVKCDEARPQCLRCINKGIKCLGYHRPLEFRIQTPEQTRDRVREAQNRPTRTVRGKQNNQALLPLSSTIDEVVAPNLAYEALSTQTRISFYDWLLYHFPRITSSFRFRVDVSWMEFLQQTPSTRSSALMWGLRALITFQMGTLQGNEKAIYCARHMYGRGIYHLRSLLRSPSALSEQSLAACVLLGGYEVLDGNCENSWISHTRGIRHVMRARGPLAHKSGMGRTLMLCFRPFLVAESFILGEPCFLGSSEWTSMTDDISSVETQRGKTELLTLIMDHAFNEVAKCAGYYSSIRSISSSDTDPDPSVLDRLQREISDTRAHLLRLRRKLDASQEDEGAEEEASFKPPIPSSHVRSMTQLTLEGLCSATALLDQLSTVLELEQNKRITRNQSSVMLRPKGTDVQDSLRGLAENFAAYAKKGPPPTVNCDPTTMSSTTRPIGDWLDKFSLVMGIADVS
ncbi:Zn(II)2Cys6 transcription factor [Aspergillus lucknowensis]|uniref:Zn(2)-C6 fungal-type domain-containing protein n=1 Tax=Aspergillus lucknowensis TaxID=176173 RepID=A0ABR4LSP7_9EURO